MTDHDATGFTPNALATSALGVDDLTGPHAAPVLRHVSLAVPRGGSHVVLGPMHSGKSTLLRLILGLDRAVSGKVTIDGSTFDAARATEDKLRQVRRRVGVVFDNSALVSRLTLLENVMLPLAEHTPVGAKDAPEMAAGLLHDVGVVGDLERTPDKLTRLDRRRAALARALVLAPAVLLVDEPGNGLDPHAAAELDETLRALHDRYRWGILICSQEVRYAFHWPSAVSVLANGRIVEEGSLDDLLNSRHEAVRRFVDRRGAA
ncbi:MAG TPA: ATP-binding cassette domain-containing protein [Gemmatimonadaceae bacterium]|nr:ATP-binding cassette domain-containing protein [Gemmatimonadaceae bacterium]